MHGRRIYNYYNHSLIAICTLIELKIFIMSITDGTLITHGGMHTTSCAYVKVCNYLIKLIQNLAWDI